MKLDILHVTILPFLPVVGCTLRCCTKMPTRCVTDNTLSCLQETIRKLSRGTFFECHVTGVTKRLLNTMNLNRDYFRILGLKCGTLNHVNCFYISFYFQDLFIADLSRTMNGRLTDLQKVEMPTLNTSTPQSGEQVDESQLQAKLEHMANMYFEKFSTPVRRL